MPSLLLANGAWFVETLQTLPEQALAQRLAYRKAHPDRREHQINSALVGPADAHDLIASLERIPILRPQTILIDADGSPEEVVDRLA